MENQRNDLSSKIKARQLQISKLDKTILQLAESVRQGIYKFCKIYPQSNFRKTDQIRKK